MSVIYHQSKKVILLLDKNHVKTMENPKTTLPFSDIYIGGAPSSILKARSVIDSGYQRYKLFLFKYGMQKIAFVFLPGKPVNWTDFSNTSG